MKFSHKAVKSGMAILALLLGRYPMSWLLSSRSSNKLSLNSDAKHQVTPVESPTGNVISVSTVGNPDKQALVFIHGINSNSQQWQHQQEFFLNDYFLVFIDLPGHGSSPNPVKYAVDAMALDLRNILIRLGIKHPILYGHSLGGMIIQQYCMEKYEPSAEAIILQNCSYTNPLDTLPIGAIPPILQRNVVVPILRQISRKKNLFNLLAYANYTSGLSSLFYRLLLFCGTQSATTLRTMSGYAAKTSVRTTAEMLIKIFEFRLTSSITDLPIPCLVLAARGDKLISTSSATYLHKLIPNSEFILLDGGHQNLVEFPETTNQAIDIFLRKHHFNQ